MDATVATKTIDFTNDMLTNILPRVKKMVEKEKQYLESLEKERQDIINKQGNRGFWLRLVPIDMSNYIDRLDEVISASRRMLNHYETRLKEYETYVIENW